MSAICAIFRLDRAPVPGSQVSALLENLNEYGSEAGTWAPETPAAPVALGCRPWRVTSEDACYHPPLHSADGRLVLVADARIDNRAELAADLGISPADARELPDAAFILAAYGAWETGCARRLLGDFAFVLWDQRSQSLFCARDGMGQRVLFYSRTPQQLTLATTAHALATFGPSRARLNEQKVADFLVLLQGQDSTFFEGIHRLPPGHSLRASAERIHIDQFWSPEPTRRIVLGSDQEYVEGFLQVFGAAVQARLRTVGPVGIMVSGGLDSSAVAAVAAEQLRQDGKILHAFHAAPRLGFEGPAKRGRISDESADVEAIARMHPNMDLRVRRPDGRTPFDGIEMTFRMTGSPPRNPGNVSWFDGIYATAGADGVRVLLAGHKGNSTISYTGMRALREAARRGHWARVWREVEALGRATRRGRKSLLIDEVLAPLVPSLVARWSQNLRRQEPATLWDTTASAVKPEFARAMQLEDRVRAARLDGFNTRRAGEVEYRTLVLRGGADVLDTYSGFRPAFGVETRDPTGDLRVVEYCFAIPGFQYLRGGVTRSLVRRAMEGRLPDQVRQRQTIGSQSADWIEWLPAMRNELQAELELLDRSDTAKRCLDLPKLRGLVDRWPERMEARHEKEYYHLLLRGLMMGRFIRWFEATYP